MKRNLVFLLMVLLPGIAGFAQDTTKVKTEVAVQETPQFELVEEEASFPGGAAGWKKFLLQNLKIDIPVKKGAPDSLYTVVVKFIIDRDGSVLEILPETSHGYGMEEEVMRLIKSGPKWIPAKRNGRIVKAFRRQPVSFLIMRE